MSLVSRKMFTPVMALFDKNGENEWNYKYFITPFEGKPANFTACTFRKGDKSSIAAISHSDNRYFFH